MEPRLEGPTADVSVVRLLLAGLEETGSDSGALAREAGLPVQALASNSIRVPTDWLSRLWRLGLARTSDPCLGVKVASHWRFGRLHLMDYLFGTAPTLAEAITGLQRYSAVLNTAANQIRLAGGEGTVTYQVRSGDPDIDAVASQYALALILLCARHATDRDIQPLHVALASAAPPRSRELAGLFGARRIDFGAESSTMTLAPADLSRPLIDADAQLGAVLRERAARVIAQAATPAWAGRVRQVITAHLADEGLSLSAAGRQLALSPRSLQRRLEAEGTTWSETVDEVRRDRAAVLLAQGFSKTAVTARLGFSDASALRSALRRWGADLAH